MDGSLFIQRHSARLAPPPPARGDRPARRLGFTVAMRLSSCKQEHLQLSQRLRTPCLGGYPALGPTPPAPPRTVTRSLYLIFSFLRSENGASFFQIKRKKHVKDGALATLLDRDGEPDGALMGNLLWEEGSKISIRARLKLVFISIDQSRIQNVFSSTFKKYFYF